MSLNLYTYCLNNPLVYLDPTGNTPIRELFGEINGTVNWHQSKSSKSELYASVKLNGICFKFVVDKDDNIRLEAADGTLLDENIGRFTFDYRNTSSNSKFMDIDTKRTLNGIGLYAVANYEDNPVTAFAAVNRSYPLPMSNSDIEFRKDFYNTLVDTGFDANSYNKQMIKSVVNDSKNKGHSIQYDLAIQTLLKQQQMYAEHITWDHLIISSIQNDTARMSIAMGYHGQGAIAKMQDSFIYGNDPYSMHVNGKEYIPKH